ncbi:MAG: ThiF family adenylyltransferase, partial [Nitrospirae bacterium]
MTSFSITFRASHFDTLISHLVREDRCERAAYILCSKNIIKSDPWDLTPHEKLLSYEVIPVANEEVITSSPSQITWRTDSFVQALKKAHKNNLIVAIAHSHPLGPCAFSNVDDDNEPDLVHLAINRNGPGTKLASILFSSDSRVIGRVWNSPNDQKP